MKFLNLKVSAIAATIVCELVSVYAYLIYVLQPQSEVAGFTGLFYAPNAMYVLVPVTGLLLSLDRKIQRIQMFGFSLLFMILPSIAFTILNTPLFFATALAIELVALAWVMASCVFLEA